MSWTSRVLSLREEKGGRLNQSFFMYFVFVWVSLGSRRGPKGADRAFWGLCWLLEAPLF